MIRRSFNPRFREPILDEIKTTTIRDACWPIGKPIMAFEWTEKPYRSKQADIAPIIVTAATVIDLWLDIETGRFCHSEIMGLGRPLWQCEGFGSLAEMDSWFRCKMLPGPTVTKFLHRFELYRQTP